MCSSDLVRLIAWYDDQNALANQDFPAVLRFSHDLQAMFAGGHAGKIDIVPKTGVGRGDFRFGAINVKAVHVPIILSAFKPSLASKSL